MTMLQELIALSANLKVGMYHVFTNNLHIYTSLPRFEEIYNTTLDIDIYKGDLRCEELFPLLAGDETHVDFVTDCMNFVDGAEQFKCEWMNNVAYPVKMAWIDKKNRAHWINEIIALDWHRCCEDWEYRRQQRNKMN